MLGGCASNPATGGASVVFSTESGENELGQEQHQKTVIDQGLIYEDDKLQAYINKIGQRLVAESEMPDKTFTFTVLDIPDINAYAAPGGYVYITRGMLAHLDNEAQLASVLGHEIGHITARHYGRQKASNVSNKVTATTVLILTGSGDLAQTSAMYGQELTSGYGREMELEADSLGTRYMHYAGYDAEEALQMIGVLKDQETYHRIKSRESGKTGATYHGLYSSHPRNDARLQKIVRTSASLEGYPDNPEIPGEFKQRMEGLVWGQSVQRTRSEDRYYNDRLGFTFEQPQDWQVSASGQTILAKSPDDKVQLQITLRYRDPTTTPEQVLKDRTGDALAEDSALEQAGLKGHTGVSGDGAKRQRLAAIDYNNLTYVFEGSAEDFATADPQLLAMIESFRPIHLRERAGGGGKFIRYIQVPRGATMASLAADSNIDDAEIQLRLINGLYPTGEPKTGDWIKVIR